MLSLIIIMLLTAVFCCYSFGYVTHPRLAYYKALLKFTVKCKDFKFGLCKVSWDKCDVSLYLDPERRAPELWDLRPSKTYDKEYWFKPGDKAPRIALLKKVIKYCEECH